MTNLDTFLRYACPLLAAAVALGWPTRPDAIKRRVLCGVLLAAVLLGGLWQYTSVHRRTGRYFNAYEMFHYALPTRYAEELGYTGLYDAAVAAALEMPRPPALPKRIRDLSTNRLVPAQRIVDRAAVTRARFSPERWAEFSQDIAWFRHRLGSKTWSRVLQDKGYNASPFYGAVTGFFTQHTPVGSPGFMALPFIDVGLLLFTLAVVTRVFGLRTAAFVLALLVTHAVTSHTHQKAALFRLDWVCALLLSVAALKRGRFAAAGVLTTWAALVRMFPAVFGFAMLVRLIDVAVTRRKLARGPAVFMGAGALTALVGVGVTLLEGGVAPWQAFFGKILAHNAQLTGWRVGFKYLFLGTWKGTSWLGLSPDAAAAHTAPLWLAVIALSLVLTALVMRRLEDHEAHAFAYCVAFVLVAPTYYYQVLLLVPALAFAARPESRSHSVALALLFLGGAVSHLLLDLMGRTWGTFFGVSTSIAVVVGFWGVTAWARQRHTARVTAPMDDATLAPAWSAQ